MAEIKNKIFHSFKEVAGYLGFKMIGDYKVSEEQKVKFTRRHLCPSCHRPMVFCGGNIMVCQAPDCKGIPHKYIDQETGKERVWYSTSYHVLDERGAKIAESMF